MVLADYGHCFKTSLECNGSAVLAWTELELFIFALGGCFSLKGIEDVLRIRNSTKSECKMNLDTCLFPYLTLIIYEKIGQTQLAY